MKRRELYSETLRFLREEEYYSILSDFISYHRIQGTGDMRESMLFLKEILDSAGVFTEYYEEEVKKGKRYFGFPYFRGYRLHSSEAIIKSNRSTTRLNFDLNPHAFIQRSKGVTARFGVVTPESQNMRNKYVLCKSLKKGIYKYLYENGAEGILLYDENAPKNARRKAQFWYFSDTEKLLSGMVLTHAEWNNLTKDVKGGKKVTIEVNTDAEFPPAYNNYLLGVIEGEKRDGILYVAHTCHAKGEANDNGSGASSLVYAAYIMQKMIEFGVIKRPPYTLYFLLVPEMWGSGLFLEKRNDLVEKNIFTGLNFDMVGSDPIKTEGRVFLEDVHGIIRTNVTELYQQILLSIHDFLDFPFAIFKRPFEGGSDHLLFQEPALQVPMPMLIHWPDKFYHTDRDVVSNINTKAIWRNVIMMVSLPYILRKKDVRFSLRRLFPKKGTEGLKKKKKGVFIPILDEDIRERLLWYRILDDKRGYVNFMHFLYYLAETLDLNTALRYIESDTGETPDKEVYEKYVKYLVEREIIEILKQDVR